MMRVYDVSPCQKPHLSPFSQISPSCAAIDKKAFLCISSKTIPLYINHSSLTKPGLYQITKKFYLKNLFTYHLLYPKNLQNPFALFFQLLPYPVYLKPFSSFPPLNVGYLPALYLCLFLDVSFLSIHL